jgi:hypothetical protein
MSLTTENPELADDGTAPVVATEATFASEEVSVFNIQLELFTPTWSLCYPAPRPFLCICRSINSRLYLKSGSSFSPNLVTTDTVLVDNLDGGSSMKSAECCETSIWDGGRLAAENGLQRV